jgi:hypothetical protein
MRTTAVILGLCAMVVGCGEQRIVGRRGLLSSVPGAQSQIPDTRVVARADVLRTPEGGIRQEREDGTVVLHAKTVHHLITHIVQAIQNNEEDLFVQQILCEQTLEEFRIRRVDPALGFQELVRRQRDAFRLFNAMPFGEGTPGLYMEPTGTNQFRLALPRSSWAELEWVGIDVVFERGNYKLRWFVNRGG